MPESLPPIDVVLSEPKLSASKTRAFQKGQQTRYAIVDAALTLASRNGLEGLSIGVVAEAAKMSKSGVFSHFGSREELQISVIREYHRRFEEEVFRPVLKENRGLPRLRGFFERWLIRVTHEIEAGCLYISGAVEFDDRPGLVRESLVGIVKTWRSALARCVQQAVDEGQLRADTDIEQVVFEIHGLVLALHHDVRFLGISDSVQRAVRGFERVIQAVAITPPALKTRRKAADRNN